MKKQVLRRKKVATAEKQIPEKHNFPIVAIGASAGGLEAVSELLKNLSPKTGMAFLYVQHLSPDHKSILGSLLSKTTSMKVQEAANNVTMLPDNVYVIPPDKEMNIRDGKIKITPRPDIPKVHLPIDILFSSLATTHKDNVIGIILSGSATDGTRGMKAIKHEGGLTFAQDETAKFASMPKSAIAEGVVDFVLPPQKIAQEISRLSKHPFIKLKRPKSHAENEIEDDNPDLKNIFILLHKVLGVDFSQYKMATIKRRIMRRMIVYKISSIKEYSTLLQEKEDEVDILYQDLLINVTAFFRESQTHQYLKTTLLPKLLKGKKPDDPLRIWVAACSTGEEAYSLAITILEIQSTKFTNIPIKIFATDLDSNAIHKARVGDYSKTELAEVSPKRLQRFYTKSQNGYRIAKPVREMCVFAQHNILSDPPFAHVDFISCCNLLIYLETAAQKKAMSIFHYAMNDNGFLMLGKSETVGQSTQLFSAFNKTFKIYSRKNYAGTRLPVILSPRFSRQIQRATNGHVIERNTLKNPPASNAGLEKAIDSFMLSRFAPASIVINEQLEILQFRGATDLYFSPSTGRATLNVLKMTRPEIAFELRTSIAKAIKTKQPVRREGIEIKSNRHNHCVNIEVFPLKNAWDEPVLIILFTEQPTQIIEETGIINKRSSATKERRIKKLEEELTAVRANMLSFSQEQEAFIEELQSANEEVVSSNEELQTVNEELETSKEEIESVNEELTTTGQELQTRNELLSESYAFAQAITNTIHEPMVVLDKDFRVKSANKSFYKKFDLSEDNTEGLLLNDLANGQWNIPKLRQLLADVITKNYEFHDFEMEHTFDSVGKKILLLNASRIIQTAHRELLVLLSLTDITEVKMLQQQILQKEIENEKIKSEILEEAVRQRTVDLIQSHTDLENTNKQLESFNYISSHDLQEPLRKIQMYATRLLEKENKNLSETGKEYFQRMQDAATRMRTLIQDLLAFSKLNTTERKFELTDLTDIINEVKTEFKEALAEKNATIEIGEMCEMEIIPFQFRQLIQNLVNNAIKFSRADTPPRIIITSKKIAARPIHHLGGKPGYHIFFSDNGIGFEQHFSERIFKLFQRLHSKEEYPGTGIGLAIVKKVVDNHNGIITATGELGKGVKYDIYIPQHTEQ